jgi:hypothetical protein
MQWLAVIPGRAEGANPESRCLLRKRLGTPDFHHDHLGSIAVITNESGAVVERNSHDAWGTRRFPDGSDDPTGSITSLTTQGFTGQEELTGFGLVHALIPCKSVI